MTSRVADPRQVSRQILRAAHQHAVNLDDFAQRAMPALRSHAVRSWVSALIQDDLALAETAARSYLHGNGFYKIVLADEHGTRLRLHVWEEGNLCEENIHDHRWPFVSSILAGTLEVDYFDASTAESENAFPLPWLHYTAARPDHPTQVQDRGLAWLQLREHRRHHCGETYQMDVGSKHRICQHAGYAATAICTRATDNLHNNLYTSRASSELALGEQRLRVATLRNVLDRFLQETSTH